MTPDDLLDGNTPLDDDESEGLIPDHITRRAELNAWEAENIRAAMVWASARRPDMLNERALRTLHRRMFDQTWRWAGSYRTSNKSIGPYGWQEVPRLIRDLLENTRVQYEASCDAPATVDVVAARFHHQLVFIHPWPNGNGRHARQATDLLLQRWHRPPFSWGAATWRSDATAAREAYLRALRAADQGDLELLVRFVRS